METVYKSKTSDLRYCHDDDYLDMLAAFAKEEWNGKGEFDGQCTYFLFDSVEDEAIFMSTSPITEERIRREFAGHAIFIAGYEG